MALTIPSFRLASVGHVFFVHVEAPRTPDRNELVSTLKKDGFGARPVNELGIEVEGDSDVLGDLEAWIAETGSPLVPQPSDGTIFLRPLSS
jgi:hypothetical protein